MTVMGRVPAILQAAKGSCRRHAVIMEKLLTIGARGGQRPGEVERLVGQVEPRPRTRFDVSRRDLRKREEAEESVEIVHPLPTPPGLRAARGRGGRSHATPAHKRPRRSGGARRGRGAGRGRGGIRPAKYLRRRTCPDPLSFIDIHPANR